MTDPSRQPAHPVVLVFVVGGSGGVAVVVVASANRPVDHNLHFAEAAPLPPLPPPHSRTRISGAFCGAEALVVLLLRLDSRAERRK